MIREEVANRDVAWPWRRTAIMLCTLLLATAVIAYPGVGPKLHKVGGGSGSLAAVSFVITTAELVPGSTAEVAITTEGRLALRSGRAVVTFDPPIFLDTPWIDFPGGPVDLTFSLTPLGPGSYAVDFVSPSGSLNLEPGRILKVQGIVRQSLLVGDLVSVALTATATGLDGNPASVSSQGITVPLDAGLDPNLTLRINDASGLVPGSTVLVEVRTYNPKPISDGQICLRFDSTAFTSLGSVTVRGDSDVAFSAQFVLPGELLVQFSSPSASINRFDGALLQVELTLADDLPPGFATIIDVDTAASSLIDHTGRTVTLQGRSGEFTVAE